MAKKSSSNPSKPDAKKKPTISLSSSFSPANKIAYSEQKAPDDTVTRQIAIDRILPRVGASVRLIDPVWVVELAETIAALGLLQPPVVDNKNRLLAGEHRRCACLLHLKLRDSKADKEQIEKLFLEWGTDPTDLPLSDSLFEQITKLDTESFLKHHPGGQVPIRIMPFDSTSPGGSALDAEVAENEKRKDFSSHEVKRLAQTLIEKGYKNTEGRPAAGTKRLMPALENIIGKSSRQILRYLNTDESQTPSAPKPLTLEMHAHAALRVLARLDPALEADGGAVPSAALATSRKLAEQLELIVKTRATNLKKKNSKK